MLVLAVGTTALAGIIVNTTGSVATSRDRAQAQAAVDAGIAAQTARLESGDLACAASAKNGVDVDGVGSARYDYILHQCGGGTATLEVRADVSGASAARQTVFRYDPTPAPPQKEPALVTRAPLDLAALTIKTVNPADPATVWVVPDTGVSGDFTCTSGGAIAGSVYLPAGTVLGAGGCEVKGDVYAEKDVTIGSGTTIRGDVVSLSGSVTVTGGNTVDGSIYAKLDVTGSGLSGRFVQNIYAGRNLDLAGGTPVARDRITYGNAFTHPANPGDAGWAVNSVAKAAVRMPTLPTAPKWEGFTQTDLDALVSSGMFAKSNWTGGCEHTWDHPMKAVIEGLTVPTLVDASACSKVDLPAQWNDLRLSTDVIFVAPSFNLLGQNFVSADGNEHRVWVISPEVPGRNCATATPINAQGIKMSPIGNSKISGMIFTQCTVHFANASEDWQGSIHAGMLTGNPNFWYKPVGFPGRELPTPGGGETGGSATKLSGLTIVSNRDLE
ncbi:hypothetical protein CW368_10785 [Actinomycetales bacterium SN12]|nr:hypothetical protein CW368_10785 [Actinomycetales bacterium SN12]